MKQSIDSEIQIVPEIMSFFGLDAPSNISTVSDGIANHSYFVKSGENEYVVKFLIAQTTEGIENDIAIQNHLTESGIRTPEYIQNENGAILFHCNDVNAVVSHRIDGVVPRNVNIKLARDFGQTLATFHRYVTRLPYIHNKGLMNPQVSGIQSAIFDRSLPRGVIHGDLHLGNVLVDSHNRDRIVAILDFEEAGENPWIVDLAVCIMGVCSSTDENALDLDLIQAAIHGYESVRTLSGDEKASFPDAIRYSAETWIKWFGDNGYAKYAERHNQRLDSFWRLDLARLFASD